MKLLTLFLASYSLFGAFGYNRAITVESGQVPSTQSNFPMVVAGTYSYLATVANGGRVTDANGYDIGFYSNANCSTGKLDWETELYTATTGAVVYHVEVSSIANGTIIYMCYGDVTITTDQSAATGAWDSTYKGVWHFRDGTTLSMAESTSNGRTATNSGSAQAIAGKIDGGASLTAASTQYMRVPSNTDMDATSFTYSIWFKTSSTGILQDMVRRDDGIGNRAFILRINTTNHVEATLIYGGVAVVASSGTYTDGNWHHAALTASFSSPNTTLTLYVDGASQGTDTSTAGNPTITLDMMIGRYQAASGSEYFNGSLDELHQWNIAQTANYLLTEYNTGTPSTFYAVGSEVNLSGGGSSLFGKVSLSGKAAIQ